MATIAVHEGCRPHRPAVRLGRPAALARATGAALLATVCAPLVPGLADCGVRAGVRHVSGR